MLSENTDEHFMHLALEQAKLAWGDTAPNPMVGAVLVKDGNVVAMGYHHRDGMPHAEIDCLQKVDFNAKDCTMYVTLEPCSTKGRTGACSDAIIRAGIKRVVAGCKDLNPAHAGRAKEVFEQNNVDCKFGVLETECKELNFIFNKNITEKSALLAIKYAITKDGKITEKQGSQSAITCEESRSDVMRWRRLFSAIGVGSGTLIADNPSLTSRLENEVYCPYRFIFDASLRLAECENIFAFKVFSDEFKNKTRIVCDSSASADKVALLKSKGIDVLAIAFEKNSKEFWNTLKTQLYAEKICSLYIEGGAGLFASICKAQAIDYVFEYVANKTFGCGLSAFDKQYFSIKPVETKCFGSDTFLRGYPEWTQKL